MLRMAHRILTTKELKWYGGYREPRDKMSSLLGGIQAELQHDIPIIVADNIAQYQAGRQLTSDPSQFPPCPPAFSSFFLEYIQPPVLAIPLEAKQEMEAWVIKQYGTLHPTTWNEEDAKEPAAKLNASARLMSPQELGFTQVGMVVEAHSRADVSQKGFNSFLKAAAPKEPDKIHWLIGGAVVHALTNGIVFLSHTLIFSLDETGRFIGEADRSFHDGHPSSFATHVLMMTLGFMQCKNVERVDVTDLEGPLPKWCRRQRVRELKYHSLRIDPNLGSKPRSGDRKTEGDRSGKALHICRGHFMRCVNDGVSKGLFGRGVYGTFWVPAHVRGSADLGKVIPTYNVLAPTG